MEYKLVKSRKEDVDRLIQYKKNNIYSYADNISKDEANQINEYLITSIPEDLDSYKNIIVDNKVIGCLLVKDKDDGIIIDEIYIESDYRNKGIGRSIISNILKNNNIVYLWVYKLNVKAISLYKSLGFDIQDETDTRYYMKYKRDD